MTQRALQAVLFDLDGTLIDSAPDLGHAAEQLRQARGLPALGLEHYRSAVGAGARGLVQRALGLTPTDPAFEPAKAEFLAHYQSCMFERTRPFAQVKALVDALRQRGLRWGVVTNKIERFALPLTAAMPLFASAGAVVGGDTTPHPKPHPAPLLEAARRLGVSANACLYVGDDARDIEAGRAAGMATVAALYGYIAHETEALAWGADAHIRAPLELLPLLANFSQARYTVGLQGLHWFRRGNGCATGHVEVLSPRKTAEKK